MTLYGFCIQIDGELYEAAAWGLDVEDAFGVLHECFELEHQRALDPNAEWEYCALAYFHSDVDLMWWLEAGEA